MSEYQWVEFRAVDTPLDDDALDFMHRQSTRANIDRWTFTNEYQFGRFRGDVLEMMRRGYDIHVHYANFGIRVLCIRIPDGIDIAQRIEPYLLENEIDWVPDTHGNGGVLVFQPEGDAGTWDWTEDVESLASDFIPLREMIISGDFRPLYIAHIAFSYDDESLEPPIPSGLRQENYALDRLCEFYEIDSDLIAVAAEMSPELSTAASDEGLIRKWLDSQTKSELSANLEKCLMQPRAFPWQLLRGVLAGSTATPEQLGKRTIGELREKAAQIEAERLRQSQAIAAEKAERNRIEAERILQVQLDKIAKDPDQVIRQIDKLLEERNRTAYRRVAEKLLLLAEACGRDAATAKADAIRYQYPTRTALSSELSKVGL